MFTYIGPGALEPQELDEELIEKEVYEIVDEMSTEHILSIPGVYDLFIEECLPYIEEKHTKKELPETEDNDDQQSIIDYINSLRSNQ